jgi:hypothetical protein
MKSHSDCTPPPVTTVSRESEAANDSIQSREGEQSTQENRIAIGFLFSLVMHLGLALFLALCVYVPKQSSRLTIELSNVAMADVFPVQFVDLSFQGVAGSEFERYESLSITAFDLNDGLAEDQLKRLMPGHSDDGVKIDGLPFENDGGEAKSPRKDRPVRFFGTQAYGNKFVYVLDISGSMQGRRLLRAQRELVKSVWALPEDYLFHVVLFNEGVFNFANTPGLRPATRTNKKLLERWIATAAAQNGTLPGLALKIAGDLQPDHVFFLSDGDFEVRDQQEGGVQGLVDLLLGSGLARPNRFQAPTIDNYVAKSILDGYAPDIVIHTFAYENMAGFQTLKTIAEEKGGTCRFVPPVR